MAGECKLSWGAQNYQVANEFAAELADGQCGLTDGFLAGDWRLPTIEEWITTVARAVALSCTGLNAPTLTNAAGTGCHSASSVFSGVLTTSYWSSTASAANPGVAQFVHLDGGFTGVSTKTGTDFVWPVRGGR